MAKLRPDATESAVQRAVTTGGARRMQAFRARQASGRVVLRIEIDLVDITEKLLEAKLIRPRDVDDRGKIEAALAHLLESWVV